MGVISPYAGIYEGQAEIKSALDEISGKLNKFIPEPHPTKAGIGSGVKLFSKARLVWWTKVEEAARYRIKLHVLADGRDCEVGTFDVERDKRYISFPDIPSDVPCSVLLQAEDRDGKVIADGYIEL